MTTASNSLVETANGSPPNSLDRGTKRLVDLFPRSLVNVATVLGFAIPTLGYLLMVRGYSVNVVTGDQWDDVVMISRSFSHLDWGSLWAQHNENRILFPNLIVLALAHTTAFNIQVEEYLSFALLAASIALIVWMHRRRSKSVPWLYYCPVVILMFSVVQYENALWGFQMAWYLVLFCLASSLILLDRITISRLSFALAIVAAVVGSYSSLQGLLIWPAGLVVLGLRRRSWWLCGIWLSAAVLTAIVYFHNFRVTSATPDHNYIWQHPVTSAKFFFFTVGNVVGLHIAFHGPVNYAVVLFGLAVTLLAVFALVVGYRSRVEGDGRPIGMALIVVGLLFAGIVTAGRAALGYWVASGSRYTSFDLLTLVGIYLTLLGPARSPRTVRRGSDRFLGATTPAWVRSFRHGLDKRGLAVARWCLLPVVLIQIGFGLHYGLTGASNNHKYQVEAAHVLRTINQQPDGVVSGYLYVFQPAKLVRHDAQILKQHHLSLFAGT